MSEWIDRKIGEVINFNPREVIKAGTVAKKIAMEKLGIFTKKINGFEYTTVQNGPKFKNGDVLVAKITPCLENGKTAKVDILEEDEVAFGSTEFIVLRENEFSINDFIYYLAISPIFRKKAISCMEGTSGRKRVNEKALKEQVIPFPDISTQQKIASVLSALDAKIELNNRINAELEAMAKTIYDYWFVQFDFPFDFAQGKPDKQEFAELSRSKPYKTNGGKMVYNKELKREIPEGWEVKKIEDFAITSSGGTPLSTKKEYYEKGNIPWINSGELNNPFIVNTSNFITEEGLNNSSAKMFPKNTILIALYGATAGKTSKIEFSACTNQAICGIITKNKNIDNFLYFGLNDLYKHLIILSTGSARDNLSQDIVRNLKFAIPNQNILEKFNEIINPSFEKIINNLKENQQLSALRDWLLPMLMNGQVTVKN